MIWVYCIELNKEVSWKQLNGIDPYPLNYECPNPECKEKTMRPVREHNRKGRPVIPHFRHLRGGCGKGETYWHRATKTFLNEKIPKFNDVIVNEKNIEIRLDNQQADVFFEFTKNREKIAIELQHSPLKYDELMRRTLGYIEKDIYPFWILDGNKTISKLARELNRVWNRGLRTSQLDRDVFEMFKRVYYINISNQKFNPNDNIKIYCVIFDDYKNCKALKKMTIKPVSSLEIEFTTTNQLKHARFVSKEMDNILLRRKKEKERRKKEKERRKKEKERLEKEEFKKRKRKQFVFDHYEYYQNRNIGMCDACGEITNLVAHFKPDKYLKVEHDFKLCRTCASIYRHERFKIKKKMRKEQKLLKMSLKFKDAVKTASRKEVVLCKKKTSDQKRF